jgi:hypothetical protein
MGKRLRYLINETINQNKNGNTVQKHDASSYYIININVFNNRKNDVDSEECK